ncbi:MAG: hypothetical protein JF619_24980 [Massilia sp.]|nr:hypothetical protein [Massilia sp.]
MKRHLCSCALTALTLLSSQAASAQQAAPAPSAQRVVVQGLKAQSDWFKAESEHFVVYSDTSRYNVFQLLNNMERLDFMLRAYTKPYLRPQPHEPKLTLYFHRRDALARHADGKPLDAVGLYNSCSAGVLAAGILMDPIVELENGSLLNGPTNDTLSYLFEGYARHFLYHHTTIRTPRSFIDGFAQYFATARFSDDQMAIGRSPVSVGRYLKLLDDGYRYGLSYIDVINDNDSGTGSYAGPGVKLDFAARSWLLTHFMLSTEDNRTRLARYLDLANRGVPATAAFETAFTITPKQLSNELWRYRRTSLIESQVEVPALPAARIAYTDLPDSVTDYVMIAATLKACPSRATGEALLRAMTSRPDGTPQHPLARLALSRAQIDWGNPQDAIADLSALAGGAEGNTEARYLLGMAHLRLASQQQGAAKADSLAAARRHLADVINADPVSAEAAYALLRAELASGEPPSESALTAAELAWKNGPEVSDYARAAALMHAYAGNSATSRLALTVLANNRRDPAMATWARQWQARLLDGVDSGEVLAELRSTLASGTVFTAWTVAQDNTMQEVALAAGKERARHALDCDNFSTGYANMSAEQKREACMALR